VISLRYHVISIAAVFLALAIGVVLGSTTLSSTLLSGLNGQKEDLGRQVSQLQADRSRLNARLAGADSFAGGIGPRAVAGALADRTVAVVRTSDVTQNDRKAVEDLIGQAGGKVTGDVQLNDSFGDPNKSDQLRDMVTRMIPAGAKLPTASDPGTLAGGLFGSLLMLGKDNKPQATGNEIISAMTGLADAGFVRADTAPQPAQLVLVLTGGRRSGEGAGDKATTLARFATQLDRSGAGAVLAGTQGSADGSGAIGVARADGSTGSVLSTVDNLDTAAGRVVTVLALAEQLEGKAGQYGTAGNAQAMTPESATSR
jgi:hypothetical protein